MLLQCTLRCQQLNAVSSVRCPLVAGPRPLYRPVVPFLQYRHPRPHHYGRQILRYAKATPGDGAEPTASSAAPASSGPPQQEQQQQSNEQAQEGNAAQHAAGHTAAAVNTEADTSSTADAPHDLASAAAYAAAGAAAAKQQRQQQAPSVPAFSLAAALAPVAQLLLGLAALAQTWLQRWLVRAGLGTGLGLLLLHLLLNRLALPLANRQLLPGLLAEVEALTLREVRLGGVSRLWLPGLFGLGPLLTLQQLEVGPGPAEKSSAQVPEVHVRVLPAASLAQRQLQLQLAVVQPHVSVVQGPNFSWLGYPQDTTPVSSRDLVPGLTARRQQQEAAAAAAAAGGSSGPRSVGSVGSWQDGSVWSATDDGSDAGDDEDEGPAPAASSRGSSASSSTSGNSFSSSRSSAWPAAGAAAGGAGGSSQGSRRPPFASMSAAGRGPNETRQQQQQGKAAAAADAGRPATLQHSDDVVGAVDQQQQQQQHAPHPGASNSSRDHLQPGLSRQQAQPWWRLPRHPQQQQQQQQQSSSASEEAGESGSGGASSSSASGIEAAVPSAQQQQQQQLQEQLQGQPLQEQLHPQQLQEQQPQQQVGGQLPAAVLQPSKDGEAGDSSSNSHTAADSDESQEQHAAGREQGTTNSSRHSSSNSSSGGESSSEGDQSDRSSAGSSAARSSSSSSSGEISEEDDSQQAEASDADLVPFTGPVTSTAAATLQPQQQQAVAAANVLSAARSWLAARAQGLASSALRAGAGAASRLASSAAGAVHVRLSGLLPPPALHSVTISSGRLDYTVWGEPLARTVQNVGMKLLLGPGYSWLDIAIEGDPVPRHPASAKITLLNPHAKRHLRHVTPGAAGAARLRRFTCDVLPPAPPAVPADPLIGAAAGEPPELLGALQQTAATAGDDADASVAAGSAVDSGLAAADSAVQQQQYSSGEEGDEELEPVLQLEGGGSRAAAHTSGNSSSSQRQIGSGSVAAAQPYTPAAAFDSVEAERSDVAAAALPLETLHIPSGQQGLPSRVHFMLPEELAPWQQQHGAGTDTALQTGGGHLTVRVLHRWTKAAAGRDNLLVSCHGTALPAPLIERLLELPMDIHAGTIDGELHIAAYDDASWNFPAITGKLACRDVDLHFWDSPDDITGAAMDLLFERDRVYLHKATGSFGAIPLSVSGDLDLSPLAGQYRLQASVGPVEVNGLRSTLGVRPIPFPVAGALRGVLHVTGPLEKPIFSGSASALRPPPALLVGAEDTPALRALLADPGAVVAYDRVPASAANGVFTLDTSTEMFVLHSGQAVPAGGGLLQAAGRMWVAAAAESDPRAIAMEAGGSGLNAGALAARYVNDPGQPATVGPAAVLAGAGPLNVRGSMSGSHLAPTTRLDWASPSGGLSGSASFTPTALQAAGSGPGFSVRASAVTSNPTAEQARAADTQAEATYYGTPRVEAFQLEGSLAGVDLLPLAAAAAPQPQAGSSSGAGSGVAGGMGGEAPPAFVDGSPVRLRVSGAVALSAVRESSPAARRQAGLMGDDGYLFTGPVVLDGLRVNQLSLARHLAGDLNLTEPRLLLRGRGAGRAGDELLELDLALPPPPAPPVDPPGPDGLIRPRLYYPPGFAPAARLARAALLPGFISSSSAVTGEQRSQAAAAQQQASQGSSGAGKGGDGAGDAAALGWDEWAAQEEQRLPWTADGTSATTAAAAAAAEAQRASHVLLRRGALHFSCTVNAAGSEFAAALEHLPLDELELGSLRGLLLGAVLDVDLGAAAGRGSVSLASPRFSGVAGTSLSAQARWERDIVLLERAVLTQPNSRYELAAEYVLPPGVALPRSIAEAQAAASAAAAPEQLAGGPSSGGHHHHHHRHHHHHHHYQHAAAGGSQEQAAGDGEAGAAAVPGSDLEGGRWRVQLVVPHAAVEELLPAGQLLRRASRVSGLDYPRAKARFLAGLAGATISSAGEFSSQVAALAEAAASAAATAAAAAGQAPATIGSSGSASAAPSLPGLQELRGSWSGRLTAVGGGPGAAAAPQLEYDLAGSGWRAGPYTLDQLLLRGSADAAEGVALEELRLAVGGATLMLRGSLLGRAQDASFALTDFPAVLLQPLFAALPALQHATPALDARAVAAGGRPPGSSMAGGPGGSFGAGASSALSGLQSRLESSLAALGLRLPQGREEADDPLAPFLSSPVSGLLNVKGSLGGSAAAPTGVLHLRLLEGALGSQRLAKAAASLALNAAQQLSLDVQLAPADSHGHIKLAGSIDLAGEPARQQQQQQQQQQQASAAGKSSSSSSIRSTNGKGSGKGGKSSRGKGSKELQQQLAQTNSMSVAADSSSSAVEPHLALALSVKDGGMCLLTGLAPGITWGGGSAAVNLAANGPAAAPLVTGSASFSKGSLSTSFLRHPVSQLSGSLSLDGQRLAVAGLEARVGPKGALALRGSLPLQHGGSGSSSSAGVQQEQEEQQQPAEGLAAGLAGIELRVRNMYSGSLDASLQVGGSLAAPQLGGQVTFSRGTAYLVPPAAGGPGGGAAGGPAAAAAVAAGNGSSSSSQLGQSELVKTAFAALKAGKARAALDQRASQQASMALPRQQLTAFGAMQQGQQQPYASADQALLGHQHHQQQQQQTPSQSLQQQQQQQQQDQPPQPQLLLAGLELVLGPELRAVFPVVLNVGVAGKLALSGDPAAPNGLRAAGTIRLEGGVLNLVATQFRLERGHPNSIAFSPEAGLDPLVDVALSSSELRAVIAGRASAWQEHLSLTALGPAAAAAAAGAGGGPGGVVGVAGGSGAAAAGGGGAVGREGGLAGLGDGDLLGGRAVARVFEGRLAEALLAEDGSLSLATLAGNTLGSLLPKIETQGQLGKARWRLVSAPSLPGLLSSADPQASPAAAGGGAGASPASDAGPRLLRSLALGTEVELALGRSLVAALSHNMPAAAADGGEAGTEVRLSLAVSRQLRLLVQQRGLRLGPSVLLQFNSEGTPWVASSQ